VTVPVTRVLRFASTKFKVSIVIRFRVNHRQRTDRQTDRRTGCNALSPW